MKKKNTKIDKIFKKNKIKEWKHFSNIIKYHFVYRERKKERQGKRERERERERERRKSEEIRKQVIIRFFL